VTSRRLPACAARLLIRRPLPDCGGRWLAAFKALGGKARPQRSQGLPANHPGGYYALHQPTIAKSHSLAETVDHGQDSEPGLPLGASATSRQNIRSRTP
jgi:hypothetical protein